MIVACTGANYDSLRQSGASSQLGIQVEYELHAFADLLSRELYYKDSSLFRVDGGGQRNPDFNCCPSSRQALEVLGEKAVEYGRVMRPTSGRYFYWPDDGSEWAWCHCSKCKGLSASDQATMVENAILKALRDNLDPKATHCHLAYHHTLQPPQRVKPDPGLFLEFAMIRRRHDRSIAQRDVALEGHDWLPSTHGAYLDLLDKNLKVFPKTTAQILEYWLDVSYFCRWRRPAKKLPWDSAVFLADAAEYAKRDVGHMTSFALWIDQNYVRQFGQPPLGKFAQALRDR